MARLGILTVGWVGSSHYCEHDVKWLPFDVVALVDVCPVHEVCWDGPNGEYRPDLVDWGLAVVDVLQNVEYSHNSKYHGAKPHGKPVPPEIAERVADYLYDIWPYPDKV